MRRLTEGARMVTICVAPAGQRGALAHFKKLVWVLEGLFGLAPCFAEGNRGMPYNLTTNFLGLASLQYAKMFFKDLGVGLRISYN